MPIDDPYEGTDGLYEEKSALDQGMVSEDRVLEGTFFSGGNLADDVAIKDERPMPPDEVVLTPRVVKTAAQLRKFLNENLPDFEAPHAYIGGEANYPDQKRYATAEVKILIARLSAYVNVALSMTHSMMAQIYQELPYTYCDLTYLPKPKDYQLLRDNGFATWFGSNSKLPPSKFDIISISNAVAIEQLNIVPLLHDSGVPIFKEQRMERADVPFVIAGGANSGTVGLWCGEWKTKDGTAYHNFVDAVIWGDGEVAAKEFCEVVREGKQKGWTKREVLRACHGRVQGFYEPDMYEHSYENGRLTDIKRKKGCEYAEFPVKRATVNDLDTVRTLETKIMPYTGDGITVDVAIAGSVGCIGSAGWGACSFCREGSEGPYRERSLPKVMEALDAATRNQGTKEVSFFSLNFNQYRDFFPLVAESVKKGYTVGLISQRVDMLAETPEQIRVQRWLKKHNYSMGVEGISQRIRAYLNKNLSEWELLKVAMEMMKNGAGEIKMMMIATGLETEHDIGEFSTLMEKVNAIREKLGSNTRFRVSFTPLVPSAYTALQFAPCNSVLKYGEKRLRQVFLKARELGWGRRMSTSGEEPLVANFLQMGGRITTGVILESWFRDTFTCHGSVPVGTWARWLSRMPKYGVVPQVLFAEKDVSYIFPWEDMAYSTSKEILWRGYLKAVAFQGVTYCLSTRTIKGVCHVNECGACDPMKTGTPDPILIKNIVGRRVAPVITAEEIAEMAKSREKVRHCRVLLDVTHPVYRFVHKSYFSGAIPRALSLVSEKFHSAFSAAIGQVRSGAGANQMKDWTMGKNIYDLALCEHMEESELKELIESANGFLLQGRIVDIRTAAHMPQLRKDVDYAIYSMFIPNKDMSYRRLRSDFERFFERQKLGKVAQIKVKKTVGKDIFRMELREMTGESIRVVEYAWSPEYRGTWVRFVVSATYNPMYVLEALTGRRAFTWKWYPINCDGYVQLAERTGEVDVFAALSDEASDCSECAGPLEIDLFSGEKNTSGVCLLCDLDQYPLDQERFFQDMPDLLEGLEFAGAVNA